jgi:crossover junction endodeoxyribonuclease RuvC
MITEIMNHKTLIAIDPGQSGGIASWSNGIIAARAMPGTEGDVLALLRHLCSDPDNTVVFLEEVGGYVGKAQPGSSMFKFGRGFGFLLGCIQTLGVRLELVRPQKWQKEFSLGTASSCATQSEWKNKLKAASQRIFPAITVTLAISDSLLLLEYAIRLQNQPAAIAA